MLVNFIGFAFLCGTGLGIVLTIILTALRKATPQRTKWVILGSASFTTIVAVGISFYAILSPTQEELLHQRFELISNPSHALQWYEHTYTSSSATGRCGGTSTDRWFGLDIESDEHTLVDWYSRQLTKDGWQLAKKVWQKDTEQGVFTLAIEVFTNTAKIDSQQWFYQIPTDVLSQKFSYLLVYVLRLHLISHESRTRCFEP